jgi:hypothetical protein
MQIMEQLYAKPNHLVWQGQEIIGRSGGPRFQLCDANNFGCIDAPGYEVVGNDVMVFVRDGAIRRIVVKDLQSPPFVTPYVSVITLAKCHVGSNPWVNLSEDDVKDVHIMYRTH